MIKTIFLMAALCASFSVQADQQVSESNIQVSEGAIAQSESRIKVSEGIIARSEKQIQLIESKGNENLTLLDRREKRKHRKIIIAEQKKITAEEKRQTAELEETIKQKLEAIESLIEKKTQ